MKHLNPRKGITTDELLVGRFRLVLLSRVKHLNPRKGITTPPPSGRRSTFYRSKCETPKSPQGDYNWRRISGDRKQSGDTARVKHLNPRQGITTPRRWGRLQSTP